MERCKKAVEYHKRGYNCAQSVLAAFTDLIGIPERQLMDLAGGFGGGAGTGELCGAVSGAVMVLGLLTPGDPADPVASKKRTVELSKELQKRFSGIFEAVRCQELLKKKFDPDERTPAAQALGLKGHCDIMIVTAVETVEAMLAEREREE